ncbi:unnamed protein product [Tuber aestivum]|uniref:THIF-type NAD/FAD binding fold domain-containing protein n=1 Tax=Tuber aestivum TaxID=59557 RepID=A0A292PL07_9PEZI|nr:unnamed protein product [Tuber aestivum]
MVYATLNLPKFSLNLHSHRAQLACTALISGAVVASTIFAFQKVKQISRLKSLKDSIPPPSEANVLTDFGAAAARSRLQDESDAVLVANVQRGDWDEDIILEQLARNRVFLGEEGLKNVRNSFVIIVGCGGVGSWVATMLLRSGVGNIRLVDFDQVTLSSLNRHAVATLADVGTPKVQALRKRLEQVAPWVEIDARNELWDMEGGAALLAGEPTFVVDAIDNMQTKVDLLFYCKTHNIPIISSMGAGCKSDPTRVCIGDISESTEDPLSRSTRRRLRQKGVSAGIPVVYSTEKPGPGKASLLPLSEGEFEKGKVDELGVLPDFRVRILPVLGTMPSIFGLCVANYVLTTIAGYPTEHSKGKDRSKLYEDMIAKLAGQESRLRGNAPGIRIPLNESDAGYIADEVFKGKSVVSGFFTRLVLTRWDPLPPRDEGFWGENDHTITTNDVVLMTKDEAKKHEKEVLKAGRSPEDVWGPDVVGAVEVRRKEEDFYSKFR